MEADDIQRWESIKKALGILSFPEFQTPRLIRMRAQLAAQEKRIDKLNLTQSREMNMLADGKILERLRAELRAPLLDISTDAELLLEGIPGISDSFRVPHKRMSDDEQLKAANRVLDNAKRYEDVFIEGGWDKNFIARTRALAKALKAKMESPDTVVNRRSPATRALPGAVKKGRQIMQGITRAMPTELGKDAAARERWNDAARIPKKLGRPKHNPRGRIIPPPPDEE